MRLFLRLCVLAALFAAAAAVTDVNFPGVYVQPSVCGPDAVATAVRVDVWMCVGVFCDDWTPN